MTKEEFGGLFAILVIFAVIVMAVQSKMSIEDECTPITHQGQSFWSCHDGIVIRR